MAYVNYEYYKTLYGENAVSETDFKRLLWNASRMVENATTGVDNVKKLKVAFPIDEDDAETVKRCILELLQIAIRIEQEEELVRNSKGTIAREDGTVMGRVVTSVSSGSESISYSAGNSAATLIDKAMADKNVQDQLYHDTITRYLSGVTDANGVNLLYMGPYPYRLE